MFDIAEATARWTRVRDVMAERDLDLLVAVDLSRDELLQCNQRWLTGYIPVGGPAAVLLSRDGSIELITERIGKPTADFYRNNTFPIELVNGFSASLLAERIAHRRPHRLGIAEPLTFPAVVARELLARGFAPELVDAFHEMQRLRLRKSPYEVSLIRRSCAIADTVWERVPEIFKIGRRNYEIVADIDHLVKHEGAEGGFHLVLPLPFFGRQIQALTNPERVGVNARYLVEISPRFEGYYSQLTIPVTSRPDDEAARIAYEDLLASKRAFEQAMRPGADLSEIARSISAFLGKRGRKMSSLSLGHFCGMALEEPRHDPGAPFILEEGMTLIFHPVLADPDLQGLLRADTYLITPSGAEKISRYEGGVLQIG